MRQTRILMGMPITLEVVLRADGGCDGVPDPFALVFGFLADIDARFSPYRPDSEVSCFDRDEIRLSALSADLRDVLAIAAATARETDGHFSVRRPDGRFDPSGIVKGWAVREAAARLRAVGIDAFCLEAGGDIQTAGRNAAGLPWRVGIRHPFDETAIVKTLALCGEGIATSGSYARGSHIYNPRDPGRRLDTVVSLTVIAADALEADRFATAAFAMGEGGIAFLDSLPGLEGYMIDRNGIATMTRGFQAYVLP